jgi:four helix bundle protein
VKDRTAATDLRARTKAFAIRIIKTCQSLPTTKEAQVLGKQLLRSGTGVAANYRAACRDRSRAEFIAKLGIVVEEANEHCSGWNFFLNPVSSHVTILNGVFEEATELLSIFAASHKTARSRNTPITKSRNHQI